MTKWTKITLATIAIWFVGMLVIAAILEEKGIKPDRPGHTWDCAEKKTC
jgi:hypothetical protein